LARFLNTCCYHDGTEYTTTQAISEIRQNRHYNSKERLMARLDTLKK
jgi:hypothetical protein